MCPRKRPALPDGLIAGTIISASPCQGEHDERRSENDYAGNQGECRAVATSTAIREYQLMSPDPAGTAGHVAA
jgi:hypothetical protein